MAKLPTSKRNALPKKSFGLPAQRKYPVNDRSHAVNAKARAQQQFNKGAISKGQLAEINALADKKLGGK